MKIKSQTKILACVLAVVAYCFCVAYTKAAEAQTGVPKVAPKAATPSESAKWIDSISIAPVGAVKTEHLDGPSQWGAGLDIGKAVNPLVSIHVLNLAFEGPGQTIHSRDSEKGGHANNGDDSFATGPNKWAGAAIDETDVQVDGKIARFSNETFSLHGVGGAQIDWNGDLNYGVNVGVKLAWDWNKNVGLVGGYTLRTWLKGETKVDSLVTAELKISF